MIIWAIIGQRIIKRCEKLDDGDKGEALALYIGEDGQSLTDKAGIADDSDVDSKTGLALALLIVHKGILEGIGSGVVCLGLVADDAGNGGEDDEKVYIDWQDFVPVTGSGNLRGQRVYSAEQLGLFRQLRCAHPKSRFVNHTAEAA